MIMYQLLILNPEDTTKTLSQRNLKFNNWSQVEQQIIDDKTRFFDRSQLPIKYQAADANVTLNGSFGV